MTVFDRTPDTHIGRKPIFFLHVPKTAGTSVRHFLEAPLYRHQIYRVVSAPNEVQRRRRERFDPSIKFVSGHVPYWFGDALPDRQTLLFVRNPVERVLSTYYFWRSQPAPAPDDASDDAALLRSIAETSLEHFVFEKDALWRGSISNYACRLVGHNQPWTFDLPYDDQTEKCARDRLESIEMVGVVERTDESLGVIARHLGIPFEGALPSQNVTHGRPKAADTSHDIIAAIQDANEGDILLWERANAVLDQRRAARPTRSFGTQKLADFDNKFAPRKEETGLVLRPGEQPILGTGWLAPWARQDLTCRFTARRGPATLYIELPTDTPLSMQIECPFTAAGFNLDKLTISIDGEPLALEIVQALERTSIFTSPFKVGSWRRLHALVFDYAEPRRGEDESGAAISEAFAVSAITFTEAPAAPHMSWRNTRALAELMRAERAAIDAKRVEAIEYVEGLKGIIERRDAYIDSLSKSLEEKDCYAASLLAALQEKDRHTASLVLTLAEKDSYSSTLLTAMEEKDSYAASLQTAIEEKDAYAASLVEAIAQKDLYAATLLAQLEGHDSDAAARTEETAALSGGVSFLSPADTTNRKHGKGQ